MAGKATEVTVGAALGGGFSPGHYGQITAWADATWRRSVSYMGGQGPTRAAPALGQAKGQLTGGHPFHPLRMADQRGAAPWGTDSAGVP